MPTPMDIQALMDALKAYIGAEVKLHIAAAELKDSRESGVMAARTDLERCLRKICGLSGTTGRMPAVQIPQDDEDPFKR